VRLAGGGGGGPAGGAEADVVTRLEGRRRRHTESEAARGREEGGIALRCVGRGAVRDLFLFAGLVGDGDGVHECLVKRREGFGWRVGQ
jgi:hypothetical protein